MTPLPSGAPSIPAAASTGRRRTRVWDLPTRLFHWFLAAAVTALVVTGTIGLMEWHFRVGYVTMALLLFRWVWGFMGGRWSRFGSFLYSPGKVVAYLRGQAHPDHLIGHSPLGALSVFALLGILSFQVATGLISDDEVAAAGPLTRFVSGSTVSLASHWHTGAGKWLVISLACLHVLAVLVCVVVKRHTLVRPMLTGDKFLDAPAEASRDSASSRAAALIVFVSCIAAAWWVSTLRA